MRSLGIILLAIFLILLAVTWIGWGALSFKFLGWCSLITAIVLLIEGIGYYYKKGGTPNSS